MLYEKQGVCKDPLLFLTFREGESDGWTGETDEGGRGLAAGGNRARGGSLLRGPSVDAARGQGGRPRRPRVLLPGRLGGLACARGRGVYGVFRGLVAGHRASAHQARALPALCRSGGEG